MKKASRSAMQKWRRSTSKAMRSIPNGITPSSHGATKPQVEALILPRRLSMARSQLRRLLNRSLCMLPGVAYYGATLHAPGEALGGAMDDGAGASVLTDARAARRTGGFCTSWRCGGD